MWLLSYFFLLVPSIGGKVFIATSYSRQWPMLKSTTGQSAENNVCCRVRILLREMYSTPPPRHREYLNRSAKGMQEYRMENVQQKDVFFTWQSLQFRTHWTILSSQDLHKIGSINISLWRREGPMRSLNSQNDYGNYNFLGESLFFQFYCHR